MKHFGSHFGSILGPPGPPKTRFSCGECCIFRKIERFEKHTKNGNLTIMEREAREARERRSMASKARAARAAKTARGRAAGSPRGAKARVARAAPDSRQQARTIAYSLARALRALAGGLSWERLGRIALLRNASEILHKSLSEASRDLPGPPGAHSGPPRAHFGPPGGHLEPPGNHFGPPGASWDAPGALLRALAGRLELERFVSFSSVFS